jgi:hypothetical protein
MRCDAPPSCPFAELYQGDALVGRICEGMVLLEAGVNAEDAFPGGVTSADREAVGIVLAARSRCTTLEMPAKEDDDG